LDGDAAVRARVNPDVERRNQRRRKR